MVTQISRPAGRHDYQRLQSAVEPHVSKTAKRRPPPHPAKRSCFRSFKTVSNATLIRLPCIAQHPPKKLRQVVDRLKIRRSAGGHMFHPAGQLAPCGIGVRPKLDHESARVFQFVHRKLRIAAALSQVIKQRSRCGDVFVAGAHSPDHDLSLCQKRVRFFPIFRELLTKESNQAQKSPESGIGAGMTAQIVDAMTTGCGARGQRGSRSCACSRPGYRRCDLR